MCHTWSCVKDDDATILPPRFILEKITRGWLENMTCGEKMQMTHLKPLLTLPVHTWYLGDEPTVAIAAEFTNILIPSCKHNFRSMVENISDLIAFLDISFKQRWRHVLGYCEEWWRWQIKHWVTTFGDIQLHRLCTIWKVLTSCNHENNWIVHSWAIWRSQPSPLWPWQQRHYWHFYQKLWWVWWRISRPEG